MPGRTWIIAPDTSSFAARWNALKAERDAGSQEALFHPHLVDGSPEDRSIERIMRDILPSFPVHHRSVCDEKGAMDEAIPYGYRTFDRQYITPDKRLINRPDPGLWTTRSQKQIYATGLSRHTPTNGPALTFAAFIPDHDHYKGSFAGRVSPMWQDSQTQEPNLKRALLSFLEDSYERKVYAGDVMAYIAAMVAHPAYTARFSEDLSTPGLRIPITADAALFTQAVELGSRVLWLHTFGERIADAASGRPAQPPRLSADRRPSVPKDGATSEEREGIPDTLGYDAGKQRLLAGHGFIDHVTPAMWAYEVSGKQVLVQWFSYRKKNRERPIIGDRRPPSKLGDIQPNHWLPGSVL